MIIKYRDELPAAAIDNEISVLQQMRPLTSEDMQLDPKFTKSQIQEALRINTQDAVHHQKWLALIRRIVPEDFDDKILLLRSLHQRRLDECLTIIAVLQSDTVN